MNRPSAPVFLLLTVLALTAPAAMAADSPPVKEERGNRRELQQQSRSLERTATAADQSNKPDDLKTTQTIRQAVVKDGNLSFASKNVKIITIDGEVTLRGPVTSMQEKVLIDKLAKTAAGETKVVNQLQVTQ